MSGNANPALNKTSPQQGPSPTPPHKGEGLNRGKTIKKPPVPETGGVFIQSVCGSIGAGFIRHVVVNRNRTGNDVSLYLVDGGQHFRRDQRLVVVVERKADAIFLEAEVGGAEFELVILCGLEGFVGRLHRRA